MARSQQGKSSYQDDEQRRDSILRQVQAYRHLVFTPKDASASAKVAETLWNINNTHQFQYWAKKQLT